MHEVFSYKHAEVAESGAIDEFVQLLAEDVALVPDGGGQRGAAIRVLHGRDAVAAFVLGVRRVAPDFLQYELTTLNGQRALLARTAEGKPFFALFAACADGVIQHIYAVSGRKLRGIR